MKRDNSNSDKCSGNIHGNRYNNRYSNSESRSNSRHNSDNNNSDKFGGNICDNNYNNSYSNSESRSNNRDNSYNNSYSNSESRSNSRHNSDNNNSDKFSGNICDNSYDNSYSNSESRSNNRDNSYSKSESCSNNRDNSYNNNSYSNSEFRSNNRDNSYNNSYSNSESRSNSHDNSDNNNNYPEPCNGDSRKSDYDNDNSDSDSSPKVVGFVLKDSNSLQSDMRGFNYFKLYMAGELLLVNDGGWTIRRYAEVRGGHLVIYRHPYRLDGYKFFHFKIRLSNLSVVPQQVPTDVKRDDRYQFALISQQESHVFQVERFNVFVKWLNAISMENLKQTSIKEVRRLQTFGAMQLRKSYSKQSQKVTRRADSAPARLETVSTTLNSNNNGSSVWRLWVPAPEKRPIRKFDSLPSDINVFQVSVKEKKQLFEKLSGRYSLSVDNLSSERATTSKNEQERALSTHDLRTLKLTPVSRRRQFFEK